MSTNDPTSQGPGEPSRDPQGPLAGNPYAQQQTTPPDLDARTPQLRASEMRRMNQRALFFLGGIVLLLLVLAYFLFLSGHAQKQKPLAQQETVTVPAAPLLPPTRPAPTPIAATPVLPPLPPQLPPAAPIPVQRTIRPAAPSLLSRRIEAEQANAGADAGGQTAAPAAPAGPVLPTGAGASPDAMADAPTSAKPLRDPDTLMPRGTFIRCVLETHIVTDIPGFSSCVVTEPVYSFNGKHLLLPKGSKLLGQYNGSPTVDRVAVIWDRIITPNGIDVNMSSPGVDNLGGAGHPGYYDSHWGQRIRAALLISMLSDAFSYEAAEHGPKTTSVISNGVALQTPFQSKTAQTVQELADQAVRQAANRPATVTINQGTVLTVYVAHDVDFSGVVARL